MKTISLEKGRIVRSGMGGFLNPPTHPEHDWSVETDLRKRPENRGGMSLSSAMDCEWLDGSTRAEARAKLESWVAPALDSPEVVKWIRQVLSYFAGCYKGDGEDSECWNASNLRISKDADPMLNTDLHAGVRLIRKFYPDFVPTREDFAQAKWGN